MTTGSPFYFAYVGPRISVDAPLAPACEGAGPRHIVFHPGDAVAYVVNELDFTVRAYGFDPERGNPTPLQVLSKSAFNMASVGLSESCG
jgi:6-phosphogluconolactonase